MKSISILIIIVSLLSHIAYADNLLTNQESIPSSQSQKPHIPDVQLIRMSFTEFKSIYSKQYSSVAEENYRRYIFHQNLRKLNAHHQKKSRLYNMKPNQFLDITSLQFKSTFTGTYPSNQHSKNVSACYLKDKKQNRQNNTYNQTYTKRNRTKKSDNSTNKYSDGSTSINNSSRQLEELQDQLNIEPKQIINETSQHTEAISKFIPPKDIDIDWTIYSGSIKYQGLCGACYAFSAVDTLAAANAIQNYGFFVPLSVQQIVDCPSNNLTFGCNGGYLQGSFSYIQLFGVTTEQQYPYSSMNSGREGKCKQVGGAFKLTSFNSINNGDCLSIINSLKIGPVAAGIAGYTLQFYDTGVFNDCNQVLDHAVVIVGYKSGFGWRIKNSWGLRWGQEGYGWIGEGNTCGICNMAVSVAL